MILKKLIYYHFIATIAALKNTGLDCWGACSQTQGPCSWCGTHGYCCTRKSGWTNTSNGCDGTFGGQGMHECTLKPGKWFIIDLLFKFVNRLYECS